MTVKEPILNLNELPQELEVTYLTPGCEPFRIYEIDVAEHGVYLIGE